MESIMNNDILLLIIIGGAVATFLVALGLALPPENNSPGALAVEENVKGLSQFRPRIMGKSNLMLPAMQYATKRAAKTDSTNQRYLRQLKQANWYWGPGEAVLPSPKAPFWNLETIWGEKIISAVLYGAIVFALVAVFGTIYGRLLGNIASYIPLLAGIALGAIVALLGFTGPDSQLSAAAVSRQRELTLEMGFRISELRSDVLSGYTIQRAIRNIAVRPGGPFVEELRRVVTVLNATKDEGLAMDSFLDRNATNEMVQEFANQIKLVTREGGEIAPALNVLTDAAQNRLRQQINAQGRKNLQEMSRPVGLASMIVTALLIMLPALSVIFGAISR
jgi:Flp pilus assembly protein TadB